MIRSTWGSGVSSTATVLIIQTKQRVTSASSLTSSWATMLAIVKCYEPHQAEEWRGAPTFCPQLAKPHDERTPASIKVFRRVGQA
eukprot:9833538-Alexandrium_andersonii.AAC.1